MVHSLFFIVSVDCTLQKLLMVCISPFLPASAFDSLNVWISCKRSLSMGLCGHWLFCNCLPPRKQFCSSFRDVAQCVLKLCSRQNSISIYSWSSLAGQCRGPQAVQYKPFQSDVAFLHLWDGLISVRTKTILSTSDIGSSTLGCFGPGVLWMPTFRKECPLGDSRYLYLYIAKPLPGRRGALNNPKQPLIN